MRFVQLLQELFVESAKTGGLEGGRLCRVVAVEVGRIYGQNDEAGSSNMQHCAIQMRNTELGTVLPSIIKCHQQRQYIHIILHQAIISHVADVR